MYSEQITGEDSPIYLVDDITEYDDSDMDTASSVVTDTTMSTLESTEAQSYFREVYGRMFPADTNLPVLLPTDKAGVLRLEQQHLSIRLMLGGNHWGPVRDVLEPDTIAGQRRRVLDLVTLEGSWAQEMSHEFPGVDFVSLDLSPLAPHKPCPNVAFEVYDLYNGFAEADESFDMVHLRHAAVPMKDFRSLIREVYRVLKPGGLLLFCEYELEAYDAEFPGVPAWASLPGISNALRLARRGLVNQGVNVYVWRELPEWLPQGSSFWDETSMLEDDSDSEDGYGGPVRGFVQVKTRENLVPAAPWSNDPRLHDVGILVQRVWADVWRNMGSSLQVGGLSAAEAAETIRAAVYEIEHPHVRIAAKLHTLCARKLGPAAEPSRSC